ncbi:hypothetical protein [Dysgonomonas sp. 25]|uniref:hypothetical protein n=1 Tax=Dysgonomonas sp. 25 TaxID=2302933 RepID=UPI0013CF7E49|nr:hypothetical protein [Dysgonomonas sp. 25]NDV69303.1 hypothetical protein [Dysgonomonas sp. 25]
MKKILFLIILVWASITGYAQSDTLIVIQGDYTFITFDSRPVPQSLHINLALEQEVETQNAYSSFVYDKIMRNYVHTFTLSPVCSRSSSKVRIRIAAPSSSLSLRGYPSDFTVTEEGSNYCTLEISAEALKSIQSRKTEISTIELSKL